MSFGALFFLTVPFPLVIAVAGLLGYGRSRLRPGGHAGAPRHEPGPPVGGAATPILGDLAEGAARPSVRGAARTLAIGVVLWFVPLALLVALLGTRDVFSSLALFFSGAAVVTFGGAYAVLTYVAQQAVEVYGWLSPTEMLDGLAMAETTPGPSDHGR